MSDMRLAKIEEKLRELEAKRSVALQRMRHEERRKRTRQAILIGQHIVDRCRMPSEETEKIERFVRRIAEALPRPKDKALLLELFPPKMEGAAPATQKGSER